jgi:hypothetical protein
MEQEVREVAAHAASQSVVCDEKIQRIQRTTDNTVQTIRCALDRSHSVAQQLRSENGRLRLQLASLEKSNTELKHSLGGSNNDCCTLRRKLQSKAAIIDYYASETSTHDTHKELMSAELKRAERRASAASNGVIATERKLLTLALHVAFLKWKVVVVAHTRCVVPPPAPLSSMFAPAPTPAASLSQDTGCQTGGSAAATPAAAATAFPAAAAEHEPLSVDRLKYVLTETIEKIATRAELAAHWKSRYEAMYLENKSLKQNSVSYS